jgi:antibiotic biosynthesis monooxygenase (ABM) superfamily enzyme
VQKRVVRRREHVISRIWHGWTTPENADAYEALLKGEIFVGIGDRQIPGYRGIHLFRRDLGDEVEFVTLMWFDSLDAVRTFAGADYEVAVVPPAARALLSHFDARSQHYEVRAERPA